MAEPLPGEVLISSAERLTDANGDATRVAQIGIVVDSLFNEAIAGRGLSKALSTINSVDSLYREQFGLALSVEIVILVSDNDSTLAFETDSLEANLGLFRNYRIESELLPDDLALVHLFSGIGSNTDAIGLAFSGAACRTDGYDVSISRPFQHQEELAAHEIGHNLGASHDDDTEACSDISDYLMFSQINSSTSREFSSCSTDSINSRLEQGVCYTDAIDIGVSLTQLESNQMLITVTNNDESRAFPAAEVDISLDNATVTEAPANCELVDASPSELQCTVAATFAGDSRDIAVKMSLDPDDERTASLNLRPVGFFDLNDSNNSAELVITGELQPLTTTQGEITGQSQSAALAGIDSPEPVLTGGSSGGGLFGSLWWLFGMCFGRRIFLRSVRHQSVRPSA